MSMFNEAFLRTGTIINDSSKIIDNKIIQQIQRTHIKSSKNNKSKHAATHHLNTVKNPNIVAGIKSLRKRAKGSSKAKEGKVIKIKKVASKRKRRKSSTSTASSSSLATAKVLRSMKLKTHKSSNEVKSRNGSRIKKIRKKVKNT